MKKRMLVLIFIIFIIGILFIITNKEEKVSENISIILSNNEGNTTTDKFPNRKDYEYEKIECDNKSGEVTPTFNEKTWKLNVTISGEKIDGDFKCNIYFKERKPASDTIIAKYSSNNTEGLIKVEQPATDQMKATTEYRYSGSDVNNYVNFNNEIWRIIGVFEVDDGTGNYEQRIKIIRDESIGNYSWDTSASGVNDFVDGGTNYYGGGINQWGESGDYEGADLMRLLNGGYENNSVNNSLYYNKGSGTCYFGYTNTTSSCDFSSIGLSDTAHLMIDNAKWYTGAVNLSSTIKLSYIEERGSLVGNADEGVTVLKTTSWIGKVALMYPSDYGYASNCPEKYLYASTEEDVRTCNDTNWLYKHLKFWLISPVVNNYSVVCGIKPEGYVGSNSAGNEAFSVYPATYLKSNIKIFSGTGEKNNPYQIAL